MRFKAVKAVDGGVVTEHSGRGAMIYSAYRQEAWTKRIDWHSRISRKLRIWRDQRWR